MASTENVSACATCSKTSAETSLKQCSGCHTVRYCSVECQKTDWKTHKKSCSTPKSKAAKASLHPDQSIAKGGSNDILSAFTNMNIPGVIEFGPVTTVGEVLRGEVQSGSSGGFKDKLYNPTPKEVVDHCQRIMKEHDKSELEKAGKEHRQVEEEENKKKDME